MNKAIFETDQTIIETAEKVAKKLGWELLKIRKFDDNPNNNYLSFVLCKRSENDYCTHIFNHSGKGGFVTGHYDFKTYEKALEDFLNRK